MRSCWGQCSISNFIMQGAGKEKKIKVNNEEGRFGTCRLELLLSTANIRDVQDELNQINKQAEEEVLKLKHKYNVCRNDLYVKRNKMISSIREFWLVTLQNHPFICNLLTEEDRKILKSMVRLDVKEANDLMSGFSISFSFSPNIYFEDEKLTKRYHFDSRGYLSVRCKPIKWKEGKGNFHNCRSNAGGKRPHTSKSFFCWFSDVVRFDGKVDEIAKIIRGDIWPNPLQYFQKVHIVALHSQQDSRTDSEEVTGGGNEADDEKEDDPSEDSAPYPMLSSLHL